MLALNPRVVDAVWAAVEPILPERSSDRHPLGCHRRRIPERGFPQCPGDPDLDRHFAEVQARLAAHMLEMNDLGLLLNPEALRRLRTNATEALRVATTYRRRVGPCG